MSKKVKIVLNSAGIREMLRSEGVQDMLSGYARQVQARAGAGYETDIFVGSGRANAGVYPDTPEAMQDNLENNTLLKAL